MCLSCTGTGERVCLSAEGFGNRQCFLESIVDKVRVGIKKHCKSSINKMANDEGSRSSSGEEESEEESQEISY